MPEQQRQIILERPELFAEVRGPRPAPEPAKGMALVRVRHVGVCGTDIHAYYGRQPFFEYPRILGHELGGEVVAANDSRILPGTICSIEPYLNDLQTQASRRGKTNCCESLRVLGVHCDGGMRPLIEMPVSKLHASAKLSTEQLALVEMLCIGAHAVDRADPGPADYVVVAGAGPIGLSVLQFALTRTSRVVAVDVDERRLAFCERGLGVPLTLNATGGNLDERLRELGGGDRPTLIFDATGNAASMTGAFDLIAHGGKIVFVGLFQGDVRFDDPNFHRREITLMSSRNATGPDFQRVIQAMENREIDTASWITHRLELGEVPEKFGTLVRDRDLRKAVIEVEGD